MAELDVTCAVPGDAAPGAARAFDPRRVAVLLPLPFDGPFDYSAPEGLDLSPGAIVEVPLGRRQVVGVVWGPGSGDVDPAKLKPVTRRFDTPPFPLALRRLIDWIADYTLSPPGTVLRLALRAPDALSPPAPLTLVRRGADPGDGQALSAQRRRVLAEVADGLARAPRDLALAAGVSPAILKAMVAAGLLVPEARVVEPAFPRPELDRARARLSDRQTAAAARLAEAAAGGFSVTLLEGVTGSGKTEVYFEAVAQCLATDRQVLILLPEIALTVQFLDRFEARFGVRPAEWHSDLSPAERRRVWRASALGRAPVVVGARSALFLPQPDLGLIVVDEEHDAAFKQEDGVIYHARDMAVVRARLGDIPIILSSATPSLETLVNIDRGRYRHVTLEARHGAAALPVSRAIDLRRDRPPRGRFLSPALVAALEETLARGEQSLLFLNRRGYAPLTLCRACGHRLACPDCTAWLIEHRFDRRLVCHHCGLTRPIPPACPQCGAEGSWIPCGPGIERLAEELALMLPEARREVLSSDQTASPREVRAVLERFSAHEIDVLIGTQIVAKGHHFPKLTLVGIVDADLGLGGADPRAGERTYQLLSQVSGRAGRAEHPGQVLIQTFDPDHPVMRALVAGDAAAFYAAQKRERQAESMPPYGRLAALILSGPDLAAVGEGARALARAAPQGPGLKVLGPAPATMALLRGQHRLRLLLKAHRRVNVPEVLRAWLAPIALPPQVRLQIDVDPQSFL